jgi:hypothetical protein
MKLTKSRLQEIIQEELEAELEEKRDMPDLEDQDRPHAKKTQSIYDGCVSSHGGEGKATKDEKAKCARVGIRQGAKGKQKQGPPYKDPLSDK